MHFKNSFKKLFTFLAVFIFFSGSLYASAQVLSPSRESQMASLWSQFNQIKVLFSSLFSSPSVSSQTQLAQVAPTNGLVGYWNFDEGTGIAANDSSGNNNTGTLTNGATWMAGNINGAVSLDGLDDFINLGKPILLTNPGAISISAWIYPTSLPTSGSIVNKSYNNSSSNAEGYDFDIGNYSVYGQISFSQGFVSGPVVRESDAVVYTNQWQHVAVTWDGTANAAGIHIYKNGAEVSYLASRNGIGSRISDSNYALAIGKNINANNWFFPGKLDEVRFYNRVLSAAEISDIYNSSGAVNPTPIPTPTPSATSIPTPTQTVTPTPTPTPTQTVTPTPMPTPTQTMTPTPMPTPTQTMTPTPTTTPSPAGTSALGAIASTMVPGEWRKITGTTGGSMFIINYPDWNDSAAWDAASGRLVVTGAGEGGWPSIITYWTETTNAWTNAPQMPAPYFDKMWGHVYDAVTIDPARRYYYQLVAIDSRVATLNQYLMRLNLATGIWTNLGAAPTPLNAGVQSEINSLVYFPERDSVILFRGADHAVLEYKEGVGWNKICHYGETCSGWTPGTNTIYVEAEYSRACGCVVIVNVANRSVWHMSSSGMITPKNPLPFTMYSGFGQLGHVIQEPVTGRLIVLSDYYSNSAYHACEYNPVADVCSFISDPPSALKGNVMGAPAANHGVILYANCWQYTDCPDPSVWVYKHASGGTSIPGPTPTFVPTPTPSPTPTIVPTPAPTLSGSLSAASADIDYQNRCSSSGVVKCWGFDNVSTDIVPGINLKPDGLGAYRASQDVFVKTSGAGSLHFTLPPPPHAGANIAGAWEPNIAAGATAALNGRKFVQGDTFYLQFRMRLSPEMLNNTWDSSWKFFMVDYQGSVCGSLALVNINYYMAGFPVGYTECGGRGTYANLDGTWNPNPPTYLQQGDYQCAYGQSGNTYPNPPCFRFKSNEWMTFYWKIHIGNWNTPNSSIEAWVASESDPVMRKWQYLTNYIFSVDDVKTWGFNNAAFMPYMTGLSSTSGLPGVTSNMWIDEFIVSTQPIAAPLASVVSLSPTPTPTTTPPPTVISTKFSINDRVQVSSGPLNVRLTANGMLLGTQATGAFGAVIGGQTNAGGYNWWNINYDTGVDGWSAEDFLVKYVSPAPAPISSPTPTPASISSPAAAPTPAPTSLPAPTQTSSPASAPSASSPAPSSSSQAPSSGSAQSSSSSQSSGGGGGGGGGGGVFYPTPTPAQQIPASPVGESETAATSQISLPSLTGPFSFGMRSAQVEILQRYLIKANLLSADSATGYYGKLTREAVIKFQAQNNIEQTGIAGPLTRKRLMDLYQAQQAMTEAQKQALILELQAQLLLLTKQLQEFLKARGM